MNKFTKQCVAAMASLAMAGTLCVAGAVVANSSAWADGTTPCTAKTAPWNLTNKQCTGKIIINKQDASNSNAALPGAVFTIQKVNTIKNSAQDTNGLNVDLTSEDGWTKLAEKVKQLNTTPLDETKLSLAAVTDATTKTTDSNGKAEFDGLALGLYLVKEKSAPTGYTTDVKPFFMTVPEITRTKDSTNNTYTYEVSVSPKNTNVKDNVIKTADNGKIVGAGDTLPYTITATVNKKKSDAADSNTGITKDDLQGFAIYDDAVTDAYDSVATTVVKEVKIVGQNDAMVAADYTLSSDALTAPEDTARTRIKVAFTDTGLGKIATAVNDANGKDVKVTVKLEFKLKTDLSNFVGSDKKLTNKSGFVPGHNAGAPDKPIPGSDATTEFRKFHIKKVDATNKTKALNKAEFKAFADETEAKKCAANPDAANACDKAMPGFASTAQTDTNATITTTGVENSVSGVTKDYVAKVTDTSSKIYLVEVKAPEGYARSEQPHEISLTSAASTATAQEVEIVNVPTRDGGFWFNLPKTGATGVTIFAIAGIGLVGIGIFVFMRNRKKDEEQQNA
ncbi:SpaH/EbpB family LPXTG-anchored major pilin [Gardnerella sp. Marseille-Q2328]|uniref:SpaH/EbpB family LPXTG-anchored major pilin n=1 Tax=Gardnerella sp. Marseille-Q2328 TaxID=2759694 RepID=UPI002025440E|nr:SpaH/EbpB family LPXTG-anchored major pilin [Gardnerella sp. Marseille-Q2328]